VLHAAPGPYQYLLRTRWDAVGQPLTVARRERVRAWLTDGDFAFTILEDCRVFWPVGGCRCS
jgi:hypothetical protein